MKLSKRDLGRIVKNVGQPIVLNFLAKLTIFNVTDFAFVGTIGGIHKFTGNLIIKP